MRCKIPDRDLAQRLDNTICLYRQVPYLVRIDGPQVQLRDIPTSKIVEIIKSDDPDFDISTIPLGYVQWGPQVVYLGRRPARIWKQAFSAENMSVKSIGGDDAAFRDANRPFTLRSREFLNMIRNDYPVLDQVLEDFRLRKEAKEIAISRDIAVQYNSNLHITYVYYKTQQVGFILPNTRRVIVPSTDFGWIVSKYLNGLSWEIE